MNSAIRTTSFALQRWVLVAKSPAPTTTVAIQLRQVHSTLGSSYAIEMQQQQQHYRSSSALSSTPPSFLRMMNNNVPTATKDSTMSMDNDVYDDVCDAYDFGYRVVSPFEAGRYTCTSAQSYDDGHAFCNDTPTTTVSYPPSGV
jgi:hypothetical protein